MPYTEDSLPFSGRVRLSRHCSYQAAKAAAPKRVVKSALYLAWLTCVASATDHQAADWFRWPLSSICSIRNGLFDRGLIDVAGTTTGKHGKRVTRWKVRTA